MLNQNRPRTLGDLREAITKTRLKFGDSEHIEWKRVLEAVNDLEQAEDCVYCTPCPLCGGKRRGVADSAPFHVILDAHQILKELQE